MVGFIEGITVHEAPHSFENAEEPFAARIDHTRLFEDGQEVRGSFHRGIGGFDNIYQDFREGIGALDGGFRLSSDVFDNGQDGTFYGANNAFIGGFF